MFPQAGEACRTDPFGPAARLLRGDYAWQSCGVNVRVRSMNLIKSAEIGLNEQSPASTTALSQLLFGVVFGNAEVLERGTFLESLRKSFLVG